LLCLLNPLRVLQKQHLTRFPADCPIRQIVTLSRTDGSQGVPAYGAVLPPAFRPGHSYLKSVALPTELPIHQDAGQNPVSLVFPRHAREAARYKETADFPEKTPPFAEFPANYAWDSHFRYFLSDQIRRNFVSEPVLEAPAVPRPARF
jgi:hypothetical protein